MRAIVLGGRPYFRDRFDYGIDDAALSAASAVIQPPAPGDTTAAEIVT